MDDPEMLFTSPAKREPWNKGKFTGAKPPLRPNDQFNFVWHYLLAFALFVAGRYEEALNAAEKSLRENASVPGAYRVRAASLSQLGRMDEARSALADFLRLAPDASVASTGAQVPLKRPGDLDRYVEALKRAGLPDS